MSSASTPPADRVWLQTLFDRSPMAIGFSRDGLMLDANTVYVRLFGYRNVDEIKGRSILDQIAPSHRPRISEYIAQRARGDVVPSHYETLGLRRDGTVFPFAITTTRVMVPDGALTIAFLADVSERENTLEALRASEERFRTLAAATLEGVFVHADGKILLANDAGAAMYGYDPASIVGVPLLALTAPESREHLADRLKHQNPGPYEGFARRRDGSTFAVEVHARTLSQGGSLIRVAVIRDISDRRRVEAERRALAEQVQQTQRLQSLGMLAGGVAHDFNNILTVISNGVALAKRKAVTGAPVTEQLDAMELATARATELCQQMLAYAGKARIEREPVELSALVVELSSMLGASISKKVSLVPRLAAGLPMLHGDATQIRQIVMNLVINASEAISAPSGSIRLSTGSGVYSAEAFARSPAGGSPKAGRYVWLEVADDGVGMDPTTLERLFDPFFSTKFVGRGLGMAAALGIVRGHEGAIEVETHKGAGTRVRVFFPVSEQALKAAPSPSSGTDALGQGLVLLVDDEKNVRVTTELLLRDLGFEVMVASDGVEAIAVFRAEAPRLDAVLLDLSMPRMDGLETLKELRRIAADVPVVLMSGFGSAPLQKQPPGLDAPDAVLPKPYRSERLLATLRSVMGR